MLAAVVEVLGRLVLEVAEQLMEVLGVLVQHHPFLECPHITLVEVVVLVILEALMLVGLVETVAVALALILE
jgi:hypothetical protein